ncbi:type VI secretion system domain-containing protein [Helicobacter sp. 14348-15]|uniref:type VI secretion system domain-containing protein n=1 Tax=Helicobacter TaxID=209 RepID=UPI001F59F750|nr:MULTISPECIES: type VI secretion system domain-containing protein [Helicobacter]MCI2236785.1 type VI secretion system domain-containing protein [Helicobacter sp. CaF467b]MCL9821810.1 type VI secretion system domain-containing protein [Helicobacter colisuis]
MTYSDSLSKDLFHLESFNILEDEMSKYKTLNHENINWDIAYKYSLDILKNASIDAKICNYFILSCINLGKEDCFNELSHLLSFLRDFLKNNPQSLNEKILNAQKKKLKDTIAFFVLETNRLGPSISKQILTKLNDNIMDIGNTINHKFNSIEIAQDTPTPNTNKVLSKPHTNNNATTSKLANLDSISTREHREIYLKLSLDLLNDDLDDLSAYAFFFEAMWGKIKKMPLHTEGITQIRFPDSSLISLLQNPKDNTNELELIQNFIKNLVLNPFWFEGLQLFHQLLAHQKRNNVCKIFMIFVNNFLSKFKEITKLKFDNGEFLCNISTFDYFSKNEELNGRQEFLKSKIQSKAKSLEETLLNIDKENSNGSLFSNINALIEMAKLFDEKGMKQNANILYLHLKEKLENTLLKDYLEEYYLFIQGKINKI